MPRLGRRGPVRGPARPVARRAVRQQQRMRRRRRRRRIMVGGAVLVGTGALVHKLTKKDADRIEQQTGKPAEELSEEELEAAMQQMGIQSQPLDAADKAALAQADSQGIGDVELDDFEEEAGDAAVSATGGESDYLSELQKLADLRDKGILTEEEFEAKKKQILGL